MTTVRHVLAVALGILLFIPAGLAFLVLMASVGLVTQVWGRAKGTAAMDVPVGDTAQAPGQPPPAASVRADHVLWFAPDRGRRH